MHCFKFQSHTFYGYELNITQYFKILWGFPDVKSEQNLKKTFNGDGV